LAGDVLEPRVAAERLQDLVLVWAAQDLADLVRGRRRVLHLIRGRDYGGRVLGDGQLAAVAVIDRPARAGNLDRLNLLILRLGRQAAPGDALDPYGPDQDEAEKDYERCEQQTDAAVDQVHGVLTAPPAVVSATTGAVVSTGT